MNFGILYGKHGTIFLGEGGQSGTAFISIFSSMACVNQPLEYLQEGPHHQCDKMLKCKVAQYLSKVAQKVATVVCIK